MRILFISDCIPIKSNGHGKITNEIYDLLCEVYGKDSIVVLAMPIPGKAEAEYYDSDYLYINEKYSVLKKVINVFFGNAPNVSTKIEIFAREIVQDQQIDIIFFADSHYGRIITRIKEDTSKEIVVLCHDIIAYAITQKGKRRTIIRWILNLLKKQREKQSYQGADNIIVFNERDCEEGIKHYGRKADLILPIFSRDMADESILQRMYHTKREDKDKLKILFVGSNFYPNVQGVLWFIQEVLPNLENVELLIVGRDMDKNKELQNSKNVVVKGYVEDLSALYYDADLCIAPIFYGSGMKTKTTEAMMYGKIYLGTTEAFCGYIGMEEYQCNTKQEFIDRIDFYIKRPAAKCEKKIRELYIKYYSRNAIKEKVGAFINQCGKNDI